MNPIKAFFNAFSNTGPKQNSTEQKGFIEDQTVRSYSLANVFGLSDSQSVYIMPRMAYYLYNRCSDLGKAVGDVSRAIAFLKKGVQQSDGGVDYNAPILELLRNPKGNLNRSQFWVSIVESFQLTQSIFIVARGQVNRPPLALEFIRPYDVQIISDAFTGYPSSIMTISAKDRREYKPIEDGGRIRYIDKIGLNELVIIRGEVSTYDEWSGQSPLCKLYYDLLMNTDGKRHNVSQLRNGAKPSMVMSPKTKEDYMPPEAIKNITQDLRSFHQGAGNSGNVMVIGKPIDLAFAGMNNKDMDFLNLLINSQDAIFNLYNIPLPLISRSAMTYDNLTTANRTFYTKGVFPVFDQIGEGLLDNLRSRYNMPADEILTFEESSIRDLQPVLVENMKKLKETEALSTNEIRNIGGFVPVDNGDSVLVAANKVPLSFVSEAMSFNPNSTGGNE